MILSTIWRFIVVPVAFVIAALAAMMLLMTLGMERMTQAMTQREGLEGIGTIYGVVLYGLQLTSGVTLLPAVAVVLLGEVGRFRSVLYYILGGGLAMAVIPLLARLGGPAATAGAGTALPVLTWQIFATAGFLGGFVYWLIAGRRA